MHGIMLPREMLIPILVDDRSVAQVRLRKPPSALALDDLDAPFISAFFADSTPARRSRED
jgi:hypothetical protein